MDKLYTFTAYLFIVTCIATNCTAKYLNRTASLSTVLQQTVRPSGLWGTTSWKREIDADGYTIHIYGWMQGSQVKIIHVNVTILAETSIVNLCSSTKCDLNQLLSLQPELKEITSDKCSLKYVCRQTCNMSKGFYRAMYKVMLQCPATHGGQTCDMRQMNVTFICKDGNRCNRTCIGPGELPPCTTSKTAETCPDIIRCVCEAESKNSSGKTSSGTPTGTATSDPASSKTSSGTPTGIATSDSASGKTSSGTPTGIATSDPASGKTSSGTPTGIATSDPASGKTSSGTPTDGQDRSQMGVLVGGVVGGLFGGVVITVVIVFLCRACRSNRRHTEDEDGAGTIESHTYLGLVSDVQQASSAPSDVYDVIKEGDDNQLGVDPSSCDQGDYVDITDDMPGVGVYSQAQAAPGMALQDGTPQPAAEYLVLEKDDPTDGDYTKLVRDWSETGSDAQGTYNKLEGKRSAEEEQEPYTKLGKATPERVRTP